MTTKDNEETNREQKMTFNLVNDNTTIKLLYN